MMVTLLAVLLAAPASVGCGPAHPVLTGDGVGAVRIGAPVSAVKRACRVLSDKTFAGDEGLLTRDIKVRLAPATITATIDENRVWRVEVDDPALRGETGLGVGSPLSALLKLPGLEGLEGEGTLFVVSPRHCGMSFELSYQPGDHDHREAWTKSALARLPSSTRVVRVLLIGCKSS